jgi:hypothetical protein
MVTEKLFIRSEAENNYISFLRSFGGLEDVFISFNVATTNEIFWSLIIWEVGSYMLGYFTGVFDGK